jgi:hypothetical protein
VSRRNISDTSATPSGIKREWYNKDFNKDDKRFIPEANCGLAAMGLESVTSVLVSIILGRI